MNLLFQFCFQFELILVHVARNWDIASMTFLCATIMGSRVVIFEV
jgi:hypothetical protein